MPGWNGVAIGVTCLMRIGVALRLDSQYDEGMAIGADTHRGCT
ncbi:hypothetical protein ACFSHT_40255 [Paraburkholderia silviterrae]|nr:hypothetical protein [Paraburkholderia silviterrae]